MVGKRPQVRILFVTSTRIGDAVLSTGLLGHLVARHPHARFTIACGKDAAPLFAAVPGLERLIVMVKKPWAGHWFGLWVRSAAIRWDLVVDLRRSGLAYCLMAGQRRVLGAPKSGRHQVENLADLFGLVPPPGPVLWSAPEDDEDAARLVPQGPPVLALGPTANWGPKTWRAGNFAALATRLTAPEGILPGARIAVLGAPAERAEAEPVLAALPADRRLDLAGSVDLMTAYACLKRAALFIGNDSGLMHMAAAAGVPTLGLFGPSPEKVYAPWGANAAIARTALSYEALTGAPDFDHRNNRTLMDGLSVEAAERAAIDLWRRSRGHAA